MDRDNKIAIFQEKVIRKVWHSEEWWFVINDVVQVLSDSKDVRQYIKRMRSRDKELSKGWGQIATPLLVETEGGEQKMNCANTEGIFRIIQSIPSPKAEPFKLWLAKVGYDRVKEIENPELAAQRTRSLYKAKGYSDEWINTRMKSIDTREKLTDEWHKRGVKEKIEYAILTAEISAATFDMTPSEYKEYKQLKKENLRDHMTEMELIFTMLGEAGTRNQAEKDDAQGFDENQKSAKTAGHAAGDARRAFEQTSGQKVITDKNYLQQIEDAKKGVLGQGKLGLETSEEEE
jgi:prophage antirepressor-like protein